MPDTVHPDRDWWLSRSTEVGPTPRSGRIAVTFVLRRKARLRYDALVAELLSPLQYVAPLDPARLFGKYGAAQRAVARVAAWAVRNGMELVEDASADHTLTATADAQSVDRLFGTKLLRWKTPAGLLDAPREGCPPVPAGLDRDVVGLLGIDRLGELGLPPTPIRSNGLDIQWTASDYRTLYGVPKELTGKGRTIGILAGGGGLEADSSSLKTYFGCLGSAVPKITVKSLLETPNEPTPVGVIEALLVKVGAGKWGTPWGCGRSSEDCPAPREAGPIDGLSQLNWTAEILMQVMIVGGIAPDAEIVVYLVPDSAGGVIAGLEAAALDQVDSVSMPWGAPEGLWTASVLRHVEKALDDAALTGVSVCCSTGNSGATLMIDHQEFGPVVQFPACSSHALAVGGTQFVEVEDGRISEAVVWNETAFGTQGATGGGFSARRKMGGWQRAAGLSRIWHTAQRCLPDVSANASFAAGCWIWYGSAEDCGVNTKSSGTSASVAIWAALSALLAEGLGTEAGVGLYVPLLYRKEVAATFLDPVSGNNSLKDGAAGFAATHGWDPCTGLGSPRFDSLLAALKPTFSAAT